MALQLRIAVREGCDGIEFIDRTGAYDPVDNPNGYGPENDVEGPQDFTSYTLKIWAPKLNPSTDTPTYTQNLLLNVPVPDDNDHYTWQTAQASVPSGVWYIQAIGTTEIASYSAGISAIMTQDVKREVVDPAMLDYDPSCGCQDGCADPLLLFTILLAVKKNGICDLAKAQKQIDWLYGQKMCS